VSSAASDEPRDRTREHRRETENKNRKKRPKQRRREETLEKDERRGAGAGAGEERIKYIVAHPYPGDRYQSSPPRPAVTYRSAKFHP